MFEADDGHGYIAPRRRAAYSWLGRWLKGREDLEPEQPIQPESEEHLRSTESGQVVVSLGGETVASLNLKRVEQGRPARPPLSGAQAVTANKELMRRDVRELAGFSPQASRLDVKPFGTIDRQGYSIEKLIYESEPGILTPALLFVPRGEGRHPAVIYVNGDGKAARAGPGGEVEQLVRRGFVVLAIDARGTGETRPLPNDEQAREVYRFFGHYDSAMTALLVGKTLVGTRAEDVSRGVDLLVSRPEVDRERIYGFGVEAGATVLLHEAVMDDRLKKVALEGMLESYESVVMYHLQRDVLESAIPGVLKEYDLPDLVAALSPRAVWITDARDPLGKRVGLAELRKVYARSIDAFTAMGAPGSIRIAVTRPGEKLGPVFEESR